MADAPREDVRAALKPFGLQWRADNLAAASREIVDRYEGQVPTAIPDLETLPGVGPYVAAATAANTSDASVILVDTNPGRGALRVAGIFGRGHARRRKATFEAVSSLLGGQAPASAWWAVLDLAASICTPRQPHCPLCPIRAECEMGYQSSVEPIE
jgi:A/G-specific adenine glycosylase